MALSMGTTWGSENDGEVTQLLRRLNEGDVGAASELFPIVLEELQVRARGEMKEQPQHHTLQPTALVNEVYLKLVNSKDQSWEGRRHFLRVASRAMKTILIDHARAKGRKKRTPIDALVEHYDKQPIGLLDLKHALEELAEIDPVAVELIELRYFVGLGEREAADAVGLSYRSAQRKWSSARALLRARLQ
ncbi:MAG: ECF-type sigma factor [Acidobacteriota bacterium]